MSALAFELPPALEATAPPEERGVARDGVRLLVAHAFDGSVFHARFSELPELLAPGDLLVVNVSATLPAAVAGVAADGSRVRVHVATRAPDLDDRWRVVEVRSADGTRPARGSVGGRITLAGGDGALSLVARYAASRRLLLAHFDGPRAVDDLLAEHGEPIRYGYVTRPWPLSAYQTVYAIIPGSAEMPSAGRPFTAGLVVSLVARGIGVAPIVLHAGVSSPERHEPPFPEQYEVAATTAAQINDARRRGGRIIAVGTTVVRALETVARPDGTVAAGSGWTSLVVEPERGVRAVDGLITGWHEPEASHLQMLAAIAGEPTLRNSYSAALHAGYLWHEFGDSHLILR